MAAEFFVPFARTPEEAEQTYEAICKYNNVPVSRSRISALSWTHNRKPYSCKVGEPLDPYFQTGAEQVIAILESKQMYMICTPSRGVIRGDPILAGKDPGRTNIWYFAPVPGPA